MITLVTGCNYSNIGREREEDGRLNASWGGCTISVMYGRSLLDHKPSHPYNAGTDYVGLSPTR